MLSRARKQVRSFEQWVQRKQDLQTGWPSTSTAAADAPRAGQHEHLPWTLNRHFLDVSVHVTRITTGFSRPLSHSICTVALTATRGWTITPGLSQRGDPVRPRCRQAPGVPPSLTHANRCTLARTLPLESGRCSRTSSCLARTLPLESGRCSRTSSCPGENRAIAREC